MKVNASGFDERDHGGAGLVVVLSEFTARKIFGTADVVGRELIVRSPRLQVARATVIDVAANTDGGHVLGDTRAFVYMPLTQRYEPFLAVTARSTGHAGTAVRALRDAFRRTDPDLAVEVIGTAGEILSGPSVFLRAAGMSARALGELTLLLAMVGLFGIQSHIVGRRTREIGVRMSFGGSAAHIYRCRQSESRL